MRILFLLTVITLSISAQAKDKSKFEPSVFEITPLNSPVKGQVAKFKFKLPAGFEVDKVKVKLVNANDLKKDQKNFGNAEVVNNELSVSVSKLPPGFYRLYVKVWDKKNKSEHDFKTMFHDYVRFVVDESMQVPMPDPKKNDATVAGVDSDNDGIRDDIQRWINETLSNVPNENLAAKQVARSMQTELLSIHDKSVSVLASFETMKANDCLAFVAGLDKEAIIRKKIEGQLLNTKDRIYASLKSEEHFHNQEYEIPSTRDEKEATCAFSSRIN